MHEKTKEKKIGCVRFVLFSGSINNKNTVNTEQCCQLKKIFLTKSIYKVYQAAGENRFACGKFFLTRLRVVQPKFRPVGNTVQRQWAADPALTWPQAWFRRGASVCRRSGGRERARRTRRVTRRREPGWSSPGWTIRPRCSLSAVAGSWAGAARYIGVSPGQLYVDLCTGAFLYAPYSFLLISNKFWMGGRVGGAVLLCYLTALVR